MATAQPQIAPSITTLSRSEWIGDIQAPNPDSSLFLPTNGGLIPNDRFMTGLKLQVAVRFTQPAIGNATGTQADAPYSIIERVQIKGTHRYRGQSELFYDMRGADIYELAKNYQARAPQSSGTLAIAANATSDIRFTLPISFIPLNCSINDKVGFLLDAPNYDQLTLTIFWADPASVFTGQSGAITMTAIGSITGSPVVSVSGDFCMSKSQFAGYLPARMWQYFFENTSSQLTNTATQQQLYLMPRGYRIRSLMIKTGVKSTTTTAGYNAYNSLSDSILGNIIPHLGTNKQLRNYRNFIALKEDTAERYLITPSTGYGILDYAQNGTLAESLDLTSAIAGPTGDTSADLAADVAGANNQAALFIVQELRGAPMTGQPAK